jgi:two-component system, chemotaxis family, response regulator Rcp1
VTPESNRPIEILLVEDNPADAHLTINTFRRGEAQPNITHVSDGEAAMDVLHRIGVHAMAPRPDLVLLDLNLPRKDGREVLAEVKADPDLRGIPVIVLSSSRAYRDVAQAYALQAASYLVKPVELDEFVRVIRAIEAYWLTSARLPMD